MAERKQQNRDLTNGKSDRQWEQRKCRSDSAWMRRNEEQKRNDPRLKTADDTIEITRQAVGMDAAPTSVLDGTAGKGGKSKGLERSLKMAIPKEVYEALEKEMEQFGES